MVERIVTTHKGNAVDIGTIIESNAKTIAAGNARVNARGDILGAGGKIIKTAEQIQQEYQNQQAGTTTQTAGVSLNQPMEQMLKGKTLVNTTEPKPIDPITKPVTFIDEMAKKARDIDSLNNFELGAAEPDNSLTPNVVFTKE